MRIKIFYVFLSPMYIRLDSSKGDCKVNTVDIRHCGERLLNVQRSSMEMKSTRCTGLRLNINAALLKTLREAISFGECLCQMSMHGNLLRSLWKAAH